jgi:hypothetical protein
MTLGVLYAGNRLRVFPKPDNPTLTIGQQGGSPPDPLIHGPKVGAGHLMGPKLSGGPPHRGSPPPLC